MGDGMGAARRDGSAADMRGASGATSIDVGKRTLIPPTGEHSASAPLPQLATGAADATDPRPPAHGQAGTPAHAPSHSIAELFGPPQAGTRDHSPAPSALPHRAEMERSFGRSLGHVQAYTGMDAELAPHGAQALASGNVVAFADVNPAPPIVAHEVTHVVQNERAGAAAPMASGVVAPRESAAEAEADAIAGHVAARGPGVCLPPITAAPASHIHLAPKLLVPEPSSLPSRTLLVPDADHPSGRGIDGEQVIQTGKTRAPGKATPLRGKSWKSLAEVTESVQVQDDSGDTLHIEVTYRLESGPAEVGEIPDLWIHTERKALLTIGSGEHAGATIVGQARLHLAPDEAHDPRAAIAKPSAGADHWAQIYLAEASQYVNLHGAGGRASLLDDAAGNDVLTYDDPLRTLIGLKNILKQQHVAGHGGDAAKMHVRAQRLLAEAQRGRIELEKEIASVRSHHDPRPGMIAPVRFLVGNIAEWLATNKQAGRDHTEDARLLTNASGELLRMIDAAEHARAPKRDQLADAIDAPIRFVERTAEGAVEVGAMAIDATVLGLDAIGKATGIGTFDYHPISNYGKAIDDSGANTTTALVAMVNGFADQWSDAIERAKHGDYRGMTDASLDTLLMIDGARTGGMISLQKAEALAGKLGGVARSARVIASGLPVEARNIAAAMADGADAFVARVRAGGMQMATSGGDGGPGPNLGGLTAETLADAAQAAKEAFKGKRLAQDASKQAEHAAGQPKHGSDGEPARTPEGRSTDPDEGRTHEDARTPSKARHYTQDDVKGKLAEARSHLAEPHFDERAWSKTGPGELIRVRDGAREVPVSARQLAHLEPDATHQTPGREVVRVEVLANAKGTPRRGDRRSPASGQPALWLSVQHPGRPSDVAAAAPGRWQSYRLAVGLKPARGLPFPDHA